MKETEISKKLDEQTWLLDQKEYRRNNEFSIEP